MRFLHSSMKLLFCCRYKVYIRKSNQQEINWDTYLTPFSNSIWFTTVAFLFIIGSGLAITQNIGRIYVKADGDQEDAQKFSFWNSLFYVYGLVCQQGSNTNSFNLD